MEKGTNTSDAAKSDKEEKESEKGGPTLFFLSSFFSLLVMSIVQLSERAFRTPFELHRGRNARFPFFFSPSFSEKYAGKEEGE